MIKRRYLTPYYANSHYHYQKSDISTSTRAKFWIFIENSGQGMLISRNGLSVSLWNSIYTNLISTPLIRKLRLETVCWSSILIDKQSALEIDDGTKVGVSNSGKIELDEIEVDEIEDGELKVKLRSKKFTIFG